MKRIIELSRQLLTNRVCSIEANLVKKRLPKSITKRTHLQNNINRGIIFGFYKDNF